MSDCLFCRIATGEMPAKAVYEDEVVFAFRDINPQAPVHVLVIPKAHVGNAAALGADAPVTAMVMAAAEIARQEGVAESGYRLVFNVGSDAGETVPHLHLHVIGGRNMEWPPG